MDVVEADAPIGEGENTQNIPDESSNDNNQKVVKRRERSRGRFKRKRHSKAQSVPDLETKVSQEGSDQFQDAKSVGMEVQYHSMPRKSRSRSGSKSRFSGLFKRKSRSASGIRSRSETDITSDTAEREHSKTHDSAGDLHSVSKTTPKTGIMKHLSENASRSAGDINKVNTGTEDFISYIRYSPTKQPRNRLKRMTVKDAIEERRSMLTTLKNQTEELNCLSSSLPDVSIVDCIDNNSLIQPAGDDVDNFVSRKSFTLPRSKKQKIHKNIPVSKFEDRTLLVHCDINGNGTIPQSDGPPAPSRVEIISNNNNSEIQKRTETNSDSDNNSDIFFECSDTPPDPAVVEYCEKTDNKTTHSSPKSGTDEGAKERIKDNSITYKSPSNAIQKHRDESRSLFLELHRKMSVISTTPIGRRESLSYSRDASPSTRLNPDTFKTNTTISRSEHSTRESRILDPSKPTLIDTDNEPQPAGLTSDVKSSHVVVETTDSVVGGKHSKQFDQNSDSSHDTCKTEDNTLNAIVTKSILPNTSNSSVNFSLIYQPVLNSYKMSPDIQIIGIKSNNDISTDVEMVVSDKIETTSDSVRETTDIVETPIAIDAAEPEAVSSKYKKKKEKKVKKSKQKKEVRKSKSKKMAKPKEVADEQGDVKMEKREDKRITLYQDTVSDSTNDKENAGKEVEEVKTEPLTDLLEQKLLLNIPTRVERSLSEGEVPRKKESPPMFHRSVSSNSTFPMPPTSDESKYKTVPIMGTCVHQKYHRSFNPQRNKKDVLKLPDGVTLLEPSYSPNNEISSQDDPIEVSKSKSSSPDEGIELHGDDDEDISLDSGVLSREVSKKDKANQNRRQRHLGRSFRSKSEKQTDAQQETAKPADEIKRLVEISTQTREEDIKMAYKLYLKSKKKKKKEREMVKKKDIKTSAVESDKEKEMLRRQAEEPSDTVFEVKTSLPLPEIRVADEEDVSVHVLSTPEAAPQNDIPLEASPNEESIQLDPHDDVVQPESGKKNTKNKKQKKKSGSILRNRFSKKSKKKKKDSGNEESEIIDERKNESSLDPSIPHIDDDTFVFIENEINLSKLSEIKETDILDDDIVEPDTSIDLPKKHLRFETINLQPIQGEEPLPPFSKSGRISRRRDSTIREKRKKCLNGFKKFVAFLFSHIGLCSLVVAYTIMGGFVFKAIEGPYEQSIRNGIREERVKLIEKLIQHAFELKMSKAGRANFSNSVEIELKKFQIKIHTETKDNGWDGNDNKEYSDMQWSFASALLYAITVMTTIGYGHVAPKTTLGRIVTIGYAVLGIPLTLLCLTNIGDVMATGFRLLYGKVCCGVCCKLFRPGRRRIPIPDPEKGLSRVIDADDQESDKPKEVIHVPTSLCILLIAGYIFSGALLFSLWEKWDYLTGSYFCFITLSTIGFGDIVPGTDLQAWAGEEKLVLCALYLVFGLSLIAMCFNLVQEDVKAKCRWLGMKMGIIDKPETGVSL